jgi:hypothetical protein
VLATVEPDTAAAVKALLLPLLFFLVVCIAVRCRAARAPPHRLEIVGGHDTPLAPGTGGVTGSQLPHEAVDCVALDHCFGCAA